MSTPKAATAPEEALVVSIPSVGRDRDHVTYTIQVEKGDIMWSVTRRYRDFQLLSKRLAQAFPNKKLPKLPPKTIKLGTAKYDEDFVEERRGLLLMYLIRVVLIADVERVETLDDFLEFSENFIFGSLHALEHVTEAQKALATLRQAAAGTGTLTVAAPRERDRKASWDDDGDSVRSAHAGSSVASSATDDGESKTTGAVQKLDLQAALKYMVTTLKELSVSFKSQTDDAAADMEAQQGVLRFLASRYGTRCDELREAQRLWDEDQARYRAQCQSAKEERFILQSHIETLQRELVSLRSKILSLEAQTELHNTRFKALRKELLAKTAGKHPGPAAAVGIPGVARPSPAPASVTRDPASPPRARQGAGPPMSPYHRSNMSDGEASTVASSIGLGDFGTVPGAAAGIAAALANAATPTNDRAGGAVATDEVSHEQLAAKLEEAEAVHRLMEGLLTALEQTGGGGGEAGAGGNGTDACLDPEFGVRMLDVATRAGNLWAPGTSGARAGLLKLCSKVMQDNVMLAQRLADARGESHDARVINSGGGGVAAGSMFSPQPNRRLRMEDTGAPHSAPRGPTSGAVRAPPSAPRPRRGSGSSGASGPAATGAGTLYGGASYTSGDSVNGDAGAGSRGTAAHPRARDGAHSRDVSGSGAGRHEDPPGAAPPLPPVPSSPATLRF